MGNLNNDHERPDEVYHAHTRLRWLTDMLKRLGLEGKPYACPARLKTNDNQYVAYLQMLIEKRSDTKDP